MEVASVFLGFKFPESNFTSMPNELIMVLPIVETLAELKVVIYILRHTWGYREFDEGKRITLDEFENGRKRRDGTRIDNGIGMVKNSIIDGIDRSMKHGFIEVEVDDRDLARIEKYYSLLMFKDCTSGYQTLNPGIPNFEPRSEKETKEKNLGIDSFSELANAVRIAPSESSDPIPSEAKAEAEAEAEGDQATVSLTVEGGIENPLQSSAKVSPLPVCPNCLGVGCGQCDDEIYNRGQAALNKERAVRANPALWDTPASEFEAGSLHTKSVPTNVPDLTQTPPVKPASANTSDVPKVETFKVGDRVDYETPNFPAVIVGFTPKKVKIISLYAPYLPNGKPSVGQERITERTVEMAALKPRTHRDVQPLDAEAERRVAAERGAGAKNNDDVPLLDGWIESVGKDTLPAGFSYGPFRRTFTKAMLKEGKTKEDLVCAGLLYKAYLDALPGTLAVNWQVEVVISEIRRALALCKDGITSLDVEKFIKEKYAETDKNGKRFWAGKLIKFEYLADNIGIWNNVDPEPTKPDLSEHPEKPGVYIPTPQAESIRKRLQAAAAEMSNRHE